eukprot:scaffold8429_cov61-Phaeocystis_antarctica.AAC.1
MLVIRGGRMYSLVSGGKNISPKKYQLIQWWCTRTCWEGTAPRRASSRASCRSARPPAPVACPTSRWRRGLFGEPSEACSGRPKRVQAAMVAVAAAAGRGRHA